MTPDGLTALAILLVCIAVILIAIAVVILTLVELDSLRRARLAEVERWESEWKAKYLP